MARIPEDFIQDLLNRVDIVDVVERYLPLKKAGQNYMACCPFHKEKSPSFTVSQTKQFYHCFGCGAHGSALSFVMEHQALSFPDAVRQLAESVGMQVPVEDKPQTEEQKKAPGIYDVLKTAFDFYRAQLKTAPQAIEYFKKRGVTGKTAARFGLGFAPGGDDWQPLKTAFADYDWNKTLAEAGLVIDKEETKRRYDRFRDRVMFPIMNQRSQIIGFGGRVMGQGEPKYLNSPETPVFEKGRELYGLPQARAAIRDHGRVLVAEGYMDVVMLHQHGVEYAVASLGTACTPEHIRKLLKLADEVVFGFDGDKAGRRAAWRALENSMPEVRDGKELRFLFLPAEHDPDSYVQEFGKAQFEQLIVQDALPLSQYLLKELSAQVDLTMEEGRAKLLRLTQPYLEQLTLAPILKLMLSKRLAELCQLTMEEMSLLLSGVSNSKQYKSSSAEQYPNDSSADFAVERDYATGDFSPPKRQFQQKQWRPKRSGAFSGGRSKRWNSDEPQRVPLPPRPRQDPLLRVLQLILYKPSLLQACAEVETNWSQQGFAGAVRSVLQYVRSQADILPQALLEHWRDEPLYARLVQVQAESQGMFDRFDDEELQAELQDTLQTAAQSQDRSSTLDRKSQLEYRDANGGLTDEEREEYLALLLRK
ncbi:DNA primase [Chitinibacter bivalviorum]|uniref:DNA primase n=1 Tax=Chitinibacter bivalviorum TaxID=2739434 RepID=A0A7H9BHT7_9NEIS|nr:DNA primase [Chitinibacter bivalviorum]QLG88185.1 DNA primase [Chitinibacter bivalviorum]